MCVVPTKSKGGLHGNIKHVVGEEGLSKSSLGDSVPLTAGEQGAESTAGKEVKGPGPSKYALSPPGRKETAVLSSLLSQNFVHDTSEPDGRPHHVSCREGTSVRFPRAFVPGLPAGRAPDVLECMLATVEGNRATNPQIKAECITKSRDEALQGVWFAECSLEEA